jgi:hypothetical protein
LSAREEVGCIMSQSPEYRDPFYSDKPMFFFAGVYADHDATESDYEAIKALQASHDIGSYDAATIMKDANGKVHVARTSLSVNSGQSRCVRRPNTAGD